MRLIAIALLVVSIAFRFANLDRKVYWHDEAFTSMVITARPGRFMREALFQNQIVKPAELLAYQRFVPDLTLRDMVVRLGIEDAQHPPLYYLLLRFGGHIWGTAPATLRSLSALLSLLVFPALYWLCLELFESSLSGWIGIALFAVSPFHLVYAQETREFGFWTALILASSALLLRVIRHPSWQGWIGYGASMIAAFYTGLFSLWIAIGHLAYTVMIDPNTRLTKQYLQVGRRPLLCFATLLGVAFVFIPWAFFILTSKTLLASTSWTSRPLSLDLHGKIAILNFSRSFVDFNLSGPIAYLLAIPILLLQGYAIYVLCRTAPTRVWGFILTFGGMTALALGLPDLLLGGQRFAIPRYLIPCFVGLQLVVIYLLATYFTETRTWKVRFASLIFSLLILLGMTSCGVYSQATSWWNKSMNSNYHQVADLINQSDRPLIIADAFSYYPVSMISLSYLLKPETQLLLLPAVGNSFSIQEIPSDVKSVFLFNLPPVFRQQFEARYQIRLTRVFQDLGNEIWKKDEFHPSTPHSSLSSPKTGVILARQPRFPAQMQFGEPGE